MFSISPKNKTKDHVEYKRDCKSKRLFVEVKPVIDSFGKVLRQLNTYKEHQKMSAEDYIILFTEDTTFNRHLKTKASRLYTHQISYHNFFIRPTSTGCCGIALEQPSLLMEKSLLSPRYLGLSPMNLMRISEQYIKKSLREIRES